MPLVDKPLGDLRTYLGISPRPADFDDYWTRALAELDATKPSPEIVPVDKLNARNVDCSDLWFQGVGGAKIYAKLLRPSQPIDGHPAILFFHGYTGNSGAWCDVKMALAGQGFTVASMDCRGQGGLSQDLGSISGPTHQGHIIRGLDDEPDKLLFRQIFLDTAQLARVVMGLPGVDPERLGTWGGSQGGALSVVCAALEPRVRKCVSLYPFLSDYRRVWEMDLAKDAYVELRTFIRQFDPLHLREDEIFHRLGYIDIRNLAPRVKADVLMGISLMDTVCPPSTQFAVFNHIESKKESVIYPDFGHESLPGFDDRAFRHMIELWDGI